MSQQSCPENWRTLAPPIPNFTHQSSTLPSLPAPSLESTLQGIKDFLRPLTRDAQEYTSVCKEIDDFKHPDGLGPSLQKIFLQRHSENGMWSHEYWDDFCYFGCPGSVVTNTSAYFGFQPRGQPGHLPQTPAARAAGITRAAMLFRQKLRSGKVAPDMTKGVELCMDTYRWMFDACRVPGENWSDEDCPDENSPNENCSNQDSDDEDSPNEDSPDEDSDDEDALDWVASYAGSPNKDLGHVIVIRKNRFWKIKVEIEGEVLGMTDLISQIQYIYDHSTNDFPAIGALTADDRETWSKNYAILSSVSRNADLIREIQASAFILSLDDSTPPPESDVDLSKALWHGTIPSPAYPTGVARDISSRFVDKPVQFIVFDNSVAGIMAEHSVIDGTSYARLCDEVMGFLVDPESDFRLSPSSSAYATPEPLDFDLTSIPEIHEAISKSQQSLIDLASSRSLSFLRTAYGKAAIKGFGIGPDGWAQMILQLAYARLAARFGDGKGRVKAWPASTYEAATIRRFHGGRLGTINVVSDECVVFVRAMLGNSATRDGRAQLLRDAVKKHQQLTSAASTGEIVDVHMCALRLCLPSSVPTPTLFTDSFYDRSCERALYTSSLYSKHLGVFGYGTLAEAFTVGYVTGFDDYLQFTITSPAELPMEEFTEEIKKAAEELFELFATSEL